MLLIVRHFTPVLQGFYYTFASLLALQVFVVLGLETALVQFVSHEWSKLRLDEHGIIVGDAASLSRLVSLGRFAFRWFAVTSGIVTTGLVLAGILFFSRSPHEGISWAVPWIALSIVTGLSLFMTPCWVLLEGCNQVAQAWSYRLAQALLGSLSAWIAILCGGGLWTASFSGAAGLLCLVCFLCSRHRTFFRTFIYIRPEEQVSWRQEIWPLQSRIAISWLSGYFSFFLFTPVLFRFQGPVIAGQMGMTWSMVGALLGMAGTVVNTKVPRYGMLIARRDYTALDRLALRAAIVSIFAAILGAVAIFCLVLTLNHLHSRFAYRILPPLPTGLFLIATILMQCGVCQSTYLRAHKREPFVGVSLAQGFLTASLTMLLGSRYGATGVAVAYLLVVVTLIPVTTLIFCRCRASWHSTLTAQPGCAKQENV